MGGTQKNHFFVLELLTVSLDTCLSKGSKLDDFTKMRLLALIVKNATNCTQVLVPLRDSLPKLKKCFLEATGDKKVQEIIIEIIILLLETLSTECRLTICDFTENLLSSVLKFYDQNLDYKKKVSFFKLLHLTVMIHHPQGRKQQEEGSLAFNWQVWDKHLNNFLEVVCLEVTFLQKLRKQDENLLKHCDQYCNLAASIYFQIFNISQVVEDNGGNSSKRQRVTFNKNKCFQDLVQELKHNHVPWLGITNVYVNKFGDTISLDDYNSLVTVIETLVTSNANVNWNTLEETSRLAVTRLSENNAEHEVLLSLWNACVRTSTVVNTAHVALHKIIKIMLTSIDLKYEEVQPLIKLYSEKGMPVTDSSLVTLNCLLHKFFNKCSSVDERHKYFSWLIEGQIMSLEVSSVREFFLRLISTENVDLTRSCNEFPETDNVRHVLFNSIEKCTLFSEFELVIRSPSDVKTRNENHVEIITEINRVIKRHLTANLSDCVGKLRRKEEMLECMNFLNIVLAYLDILLRYKFVDHDDIRVDEMHCLLKSGLTVMYMSLTNILKNVQVLNSAQLIQGVQAILIGDYDSLLALEARQCMNEEFFECVNNIMNKNDETDDVVMFEGDEEDPNPLIHNCILLLAAYCLKSYHYPKEVFDGMLKYIEDLIEEDTMNYLCEHQPLAIFKALIKLWANVLNENIFEFKVLLLHNFMTFLETIPLGHQSDAFVCKFACSSISHAVKNSQSKHEISAFAKALKIVFKKLLIRNVDVLRKAVSEVLSILMIKIEEGFNTECAELLDYLVVDMKDYLKQSEDVIDFVASLSQRSTENINCSTKVKFLEKIQIFAKGLSCPSHETLLKLRLLLKVNKEYTLKLSEELNNKGFSDDCGNSVIHQIVYALSKTLKDASDDKTKIEACNCLSEIGNYDLKTLVTVPPSDTKRVLSVHPKQYFAMVVMSSLAEVLFDEQPGVTNGAAKTLKRLLQYREGKTALDLEEECKQILQPFASTQCHTGAEFKINEMKFNSLRQPEHWLLNPNEDHTKWLIRLTVALLDVLATQENYLNVLRAVCIVKPEVCEKILPSLMGVLLECSSDQHVTIIRELLNHFFKHIWNSNFDSIENSEDSICRRNSTALDQDHKMVVQYLLNIVNFIRLQKSNYQPRTDRTFETYNYLRLDYDKVAWAATIADQNLAAIYYGELWANAQNNGVPPSSPEATTLLNGGEDLQKIFRKCYVSIGELDSIDGCGTAHLTSEEEKRKHLINTGQFADALLLLDIALSSGGQVDPHLQHGVVKSLHKSGMHHLALQYIKSLPENNEFNDVKYECLSFLGDWSDLVDIRELEDKFKQPNSNPNSIAKALRYSCLKNCLNLHTSPDFESKVLMPLNLAKLAIAKLCQNLNMENCQNVYKVLTKLHLLDDIEDYFSVRCNKSTIKNLLNQWQVERLPVFNDFKHLEALVSQRNVILEHAAKTYNDFLKDITSLQLQYAELGLSNQRIKMAQRLLAVAKRLQNSQDVTLIDSQISWAKGHKDIALSLLRNIVSDRTPDVKLAAVSLRQYGLWMAESKCDNPRDIIDKYLKKSLKVLSQNDHVETRLKVYYDIAKFADAEYKQVVTYMDSTVFEKKLKVLENMKDEACTLRSQAQRNLSKDERKALAAHEKFGNIEEAEIASIRTEKESFLHLAMRYYLISLKLSECNNLSVFRVISLWLDNTDLEFVDSEDGNFEDLLHSIPSRKYITVLPQLAPRLTNETTLFANNLKKIIKRCAMDHPHHTLPIMFSLKNSDKDQFILNASSNQYGAPQVTRPKCNEPRVVSAKAMITQLASETALAAVIEQMEKMCDAIISFANFTPKTKDTNKKQAVPKAERIHRLGHLDAIPIPTVTIPVRNDCDYLDIPTLVAFENYFEPAGGINCPKKINCKGSDGISRILLIKGEDDLRQDAVMQQVFNIVNILIEKDPVTSRNKLNIRTYKVVPMSRKSGVLEWCEGTMPVGTYLVGNSGAHARYHPQDISAQVARQKLIALYEKRRPNQEKLTAFLKLMKEFRPAFHYFFTEHYLDPVTWYERRLAYTKSVATSSMVGYILGLGDRHLQNILIDKKTAEVVHIDFGIAFDQGKTLPTPETIPFRLTQDIVAGFGCSGVEGIFRRCCEKTMQLLRDNQDTLLTILEVLLCDPLYSWTVTSKQQDVLTIQTASSDGSLAKRALLTVSSKLSGTEGGVTGGVAVPGQVARLIHTAMDPVNLSRLYPGWQPYL
ncbi:serine-protein kinase ATM isoform X2 [Hyposmocoma kahamanoa]|uniref:serine-protein kinase ATM isoform X2 n=1 Tax=Hyposmocoma kahamanoa TaxID=1477025 RepID=UPI000E6D9A24|nr:serine-protein kinase ATM isoform X2 [Hyposmocoma kahamanoa]